MKPSVPSSFDMIGDILIVEIPEGQEKNEKKLAEVLL